MTNIKQPKIRFKGHINDWEQRKLGSMVDYVKGYAFKSNTYVDDGVRIIRVSDLSKSEIKKNGDMIYISKKDSELFNKYVINKSDIIVTTVGSKSEMKDSAVGRPIMVRSANEGLLNQNLVKLEPKNQYNSYFIFNNLLMDRYSYYISLIERGNANQANITINDLWEYSLYTPNISEQTKIGEFFKTLDDIISLYQQKLEVTKQFKQTMLKKIFPRNGKNIPEIRFKGFTDDWEECKLGDLIIKNSLRNKDLKVSNVESISNKSGFIKQTEQFNDYSVASSDLSNYYVISENNFAYNPSRINVGSIGYKKFGEPISIISPLYISFYTNNDLNDLFLWYWFKTDYFNRQRQSFSEGGVRDTLSFNKLVDMKIAIPKNEEQELIGEYFEELDTQIKSLEQKLESYKEFKKAMLQKMFI